MLSITVFTTVSLDNIIFECSAARDLTDESIFFSIKRGWFVRVLGNKYRAILCINKDLERFSINHITI